MRIQWSGHTCPNCKDEDTARSRNKGIDGLVKLVLPLHPRRCMMCYTRFWSWNSRSQSLKQLAVWAAVIAILIAFNGLIKPLAQKAPSAQQFAAIEETKRLPEENASKVDKAIAEPAVTQIAPGVSDSYPTTVNSATKVAQTSDTRPTVKRSDRKTMSVGELSIAKLIEKRDSGESTQTKPVDQQTGEKTEPQKSVVSAVEEPGSATVASQAKPNDDGNNVAKVVADQQASAVQGVVNQEVLNKAVESAKRRWLVFRLLNSWRTAWQSKNLPVYFDSYSPGFQPNGGLSVDRWQEQRRQRINKPEWIKIAVVGPKVTFADGFDKAYIDFEQQYEASNYQDRSRKRLTLEFADGRWLIVGEQSL